MSTVSWCGTRPSLFKSFTLQSSTSIVWCIYMYKMYTSLCESSLNCARGGTSKIYMHNNKFISSKKESWRHTQTGIHRLKLNWNTDRQMDPYRQTGRQTGKDTQTHRRDRHNDPHTDIRTDTRNRHSDRPSYKCNDKHVYREINVPIISSA